MLHSMRFLRLDGSLGFCVSAAKICYFAVLVVLIQGCKGNVQPQPVVTKAEQAASAHRARVERASLARLARIENLSAQAESALLNGRLTLPEHDNAYDRFNAILMLDSSNQYATSGRRRILLSYITRIHQALSAGRFTRAGSMLSRLELYYKEDPLMPALRVKVMQAEKAVVDQYATLSTSSDQKMRLPASLLSKRGAEIKALLSQAAHRVEASDETVVISARSDREGRWVYKTMRAVVPSYRIRGDIRIRREPSILFVDSGVGEGQAKPSSDESLVHKPITAVAGEPLLKELESPLIVVESESNISTENR